LLKIILDPSLETDQHVGARLHRLRDWGTTTVYPLLLHLLDRRESGTATSAEIASAMLFVESFFVRRLLIGRATANLNRILLSVVTEMDKDLPVDSAVHAYLSTGRKYYASDDEVQAGVRSIPFYLNGRPQQRSLVLAWLEKSYGSKEPVDVSSLTIEHVMPQTSTAEWRAMLSGDLDPAENFEQVYESLLHTMGNLTLTGYNAKLSNSSFTVKREHLKASGLSMNQEIAQQSRWGRPQIQERADALAERIISIWPRPIAGSRVSSSTAWDVMDRVLAELPAGCWTTYGDLAAITGSHPVAIGARLATTETPHAHRVLQLGGTVSPSFKWLDPNRTDDPHDLLQAEGVRFDQQGRAAEDQRVDLETLAQLIGMDTEELPTTSANDVVGHDKLRERFVQQLTDLQAAEVAEAALLVLDSWVSKGGHIEYGTGSSETSCFFMAREKHEQGGNIWPAAIYPSGKFEIVFKYLSTRTPFDDLAMREELRQRFNKVPGVAIPSAKIGLRPGFQLTVLTDPGSRDRVVDALNWFYVQARIGL
jgi:alkylated DNA nucleotide flippase Atl1